jgi:hypothetical protein
MGQLVPLYSEALIAAHETSDAVTAVAMTDR